MTHPELVAIAERWLRRRCGVVVTEYSTGDSEIPDALGFSSIARSTLIECKASRSDFLADQKKRHRNGRGLGRYRYYLVPDDMIQKHEVPEGWGLLYTNGRRVRTIVGARLRPESQDKDYAVMYSLLRRMELRGLLRQAKELLDG